MLVDPASMQYVDGSTVDFTESFMGSGFEVSNPNVVASCGCGSSFRVADEEPSCGAGLTADRDLDWDGCVNARDLGGLPTARRRRRRAAAR